MVRVLQSIVIGALLLVANAGHARADGAQEDAQLNAAVAVENDGGDFRPLEKLVLRTTRGRAFREGGRLTLFLEDGGQLTLENHECPPREFASREDCVSYRLLAVLPSRLAFVVEAEADGRDEIRIVDGRTGRQTILPAVPQFGPDGGEFITFDNRVGRDKPDITVWQWRGGTARIVWHHGLGLDPVYHATALVRWAQPDAIHLELWCAAGPHWPATVLRRPEGWRLETKWPALGARRCGKTRP